MSRLGMIPWIVGHHDICDNSLKIKRYKNNKR